MRNKWRNSSVDLILWDVESICCEHDGTCSSYRPSFPPQHEPVTASDDVAEEWQQWADRQVATTTAAAAATCCRQSKHVSDWSTFSCVCSSDIPDASDHSWSVVSQRCCNNTWMSEWDEGNKCQLCQCLVTLFQRQVASACWTWNNSFWASAILSPLSNTLMNEWMNEFYFGIYQGYITE